MKVLSNSEIKTNLSNLNEWEFSNNSIQKEFTLKDFNEAVSFFNSIALEAEKMDHHPDVLVHSWNKIKITISTHSAGGVTENDIRLAQKIEARLK